ncbi:hypothetical protein BDV93DRAFT_566312 [Ceratobasidium sp. AG-I]|nr:hypothetical protein BDV93DRAFT_566312 [Ceratobasidium sp. AG-I]
MSHSTPTDSIAQSRAKRERLPPHRYRDQPANSDTTRTKPPKSASAPLNANAGPDDKANLGARDTHATPGSQQANVNLGGCPKRKTVPTERGELDAKERATDRQQHEDKMNAKKRKMAAEARGNALQPGPLTPAPKRPKGKRDSKNILDWQLEQLTDEDDIRMWLCQALLKRGPVTDEELKLPTIDLMEMWTDVPDANVIEVASKSQRVPPDPVHVKIEGVSQALKPDRRTVPGPKLKSTDHTTIGMGNAQPFSERARTSNGKPGLIEGAPIMTDDEIREFRMKYGHLDLSDFKQLQSANPSPRHHPFPPSSHPPGPNNPSDKSAAANASSTCTKPAPAGSKVSRPSGATHQTPTTKTAAKRIPQPDRLVVPSAARPAQQRTPKRAIAQPQPTYTNDQPRSRPANPRVAPVNATKDDDDDPEEAVIVDEEGETSMHGKQTGSRKGSRKETKKSEAQLYKFGPAKGLVQLLKERIHLFILVKCRFADILPSNTYVDPPPYSDVNRGNQVDKVNCEA